MSEEKEEVANNETKEAEELLDTDEKKDEKQKKKEEELNRKNRMKAEMDKFKELETWNTEQVITWLKENDISDEACEHFQRENIVGTDLPIMGRVDLVDMGLAVGDRIRVLRLLHDFKYAYLVLKMSTVIWDGTEWHLTPCWPIFKSHYTLTKTTLTVRLDRCCGSSQDRIDLSSITDVDFVQECMTSTIQLTSEDVTSPYLEIKLGRDEGETVFGQIRDAWEIDQQTLANARFGNKEDAYA